MKSLDEEKIETEIDYINESLKMNLKSLFSHYNTDDYSVAKKQQFP